MCLHAAKYILHLLAAAFTRRHWCCVCCTGAPASQLPLPLQPLRQQQQVQLPAALLLQQLQPAGSLLHSSYMSGGTDYAPVHGSAGAAAAALTNRAKVGAQDTISSCYTICLCLPAVFNLK
jgi:hypothetical protein